jgi:hypothetical protein
VKCSRGDVQYVAASQAIGSHFVMCAGHGRLFHLQKREVRFISCFVSSQQ